MRKMFKTYSAFSRAGLQNALAYKWNFFGFFLGNSLFCFAQFFIWKAVFGQNNTIQDFSFLDMSVYVFLANICGYLTASDSTFSIGEEIHDGSIAMRLIKPIKVDLSILFFELGGKVIMVSMLFVPIVAGLEIYRGVKAGEVLFSVPCFLLFLLSISLSYLLCFYFNLVFGYFAFFLLNLWGFNILKESITKFLSGAVIPLMFLPAGFAKVLTVLPFSSMIFSPVMIYMGKYTGTKLIVTLGMQFFWLVAFYLLSKFIWHIASKHLCVQGG